MVAEVVTRLWPFEADEVDRDQGRALMKQLKVGVLPIGTDGAPHDRAGRHLDG